MIVWGYCNPSDFCGLNICRVIVSSVECLFASLLLVGIIYLFPIGETNRVIYDMRYSSRKASICFGVIELLLVGNMFYAYDHMKHLLPEEIADEWARDMGGLSIAIIGSMVLLSNDSNYRKHLKNKESEKYKMVSYNNPYDGTENE